METGGFQELIFRQRPEIGRVIFIAAPLRGSELAGNKLAYYHAGRFKQLSQFGGQVIREWIA